jgi:hypothetical protein
VGQYEVGLSRHFITRFALVRPPVTKVSADGPSFCLPGPRVRVGHPRSWLALLILHRLLVNQGVSTSSSFRRYDFTFIRLSIWALPSSVTPITCSLPASLRSVRGFVDPTRERATTGPAPFKHLVIVRGQRHPPDCSTNILFIAAFLFPTTFVTVGFGKCSPDNLS